MSLGVGKFMLVNRSHFINALAGKPTAKSVFFFVAGKLGIAERIPEGVVCPICGKVCKNTRLLKSHIAKTHGDVVDDLIREYFSIKVGI